MGEINGRMKQALDSALVLPDAAKAIRNILNVNASGIGGVTFTVGAEVATVVTVNVQVNDPQGKPVQQRVALPLLLLADANGDAFTSTNYDTIAAGTDGALLELVADKVLLGITEADGDLDVAITEAAASTCYLAAVLPDGRLAISGAITHAGE